MIQPQSRLMPQAAPSAAEREPASFGLADPAVAALQVLLRIERDARRCACVADLHYLVANDVRPILGARQVFVLTDEGGTRTVAAVSSVTTVDREAPFVQWIEGVAVRRVPATATSPVRLDLTAEGVSHGDHAEHYPFAQLLALPLADRAGRPLGLILLARESEWDEDACRIGERLAECFAHAWSGFRRPPAALHRLRKPGFVAAAVAALLVVLALTPTHVTALAPFEIVPDRPFIVAASSDGTIESVAVQPNSTVAAGALLYTTVSTTLRDNLVIAERTVAVAEAKWKQLRQAAFLDPQAKRDLAAAEAEYELRRAERDYARDLLDKAVTRAPRAGIAIFNDATDLLGRPVQTGQRIMEIADREHVMARVAVPVDDSIVLNDGARVKLFLDSAPLHAVEARLDHASHGAEMGENNVFAFRAEARLSPDAIVPRLGVRGTAEVYGPRSSLLLYLFRRPLSYVRQHVGL